MEYTRSVGDYHEYFEGTPSEIAALIQLMENKGVSAKINVPKIKLPNICPAGLKGDKSVNSKILKGGE